MEPVTCKETDLLKTVMQTLIKRKSNHIFVVDKENKPFKIITLNEVICKFSPYDYKLSDYFF